MMLWSWTVILNLQWIWTQITPQTSMLGVKKAEDLVWGRYVVVGGMSPSFSPQIHPEPKEADPKIDFFQWFRQLVNCTEGRVPRLFATGCHLGGLGIVEHYGPTAAVCSVNK